jgi:hypothetical protein
MSTKAELKAFFETGDTPTQAQFADLIESLGLETETAANNAKVSFDGTSSTKLGTIAENAEVNTIETLTAGEPTGSDLVLNVVSLSQAEYDAGTKVATTFYLIV